MSKRIVKPSLTDSEFLASIGPRLSHDGAYWRLNGILEAGHGHTFEDEAARLVALCNQAGSHAEIKAMYKWWTIYKTYHDARRDHFYNHTILSIRGPITKRLEALMASNKQ